MQDSILNLNGRNSNCEKLFTNNKNTKTDRYSQFVFTNGKRNARLEDYFKPLDKIKAKENFAWGEELSIKKKLIQLAEANKWEEVEKSFYAICSNLLSFSFIKSKEIAFDLAKIAKRKGEFRKGINYLELWKRFNPYEQEEDIESKIEYLNNAIKVSVNTEYVDEKKYYTPEMQIIANFINDIIKKESVNYENYANQTKMTLEDIFRIVLKIRKLLNFLSKHPEWNIVEINKTIALSKFLIYFAINKMRKSLSFEKINISIESKK